MKVKVFTVLTLAFALFMRACGKSDADLQKAATDKLTADKVIGVTVAVKDGVATLTGEVADATVKSKAEASVKTVEGIKSVTNSTTIKPLPTPPPPSPDKMLEGTINEGHQEERHHGRNRYGRKRRSNVLAATLHKAKVAEVMRPPTKRRTNAKVINKLNRK